MRLPGVLSITRPLNSLVSGIAALLGYLVATGTITLSSFILVPVVVLITAAGNVINDYFDAEIDAVNRPERPIPAGSVRRSSARSYAITLFLAGILISLGTGPLCVGIAAFNSVLLVLYAARLKRVPLAGNAAVSYLTASVFLFGGAFAGTDGILLNLPLAAVAFLASLARELLKDAEDVEGDASGGAITVPIRAGIPATTRFALACALLAAAASAIPWFAWGWPYLAAIACVDILIIAAVAKTLSCSTPACIRESGAATMLKAGFFSSLLVFALAAYLL